MKWKEKEMEITPPHTDAPIGGAPFTPIATVASDIGSMTQPPDFAAMQRQIDEARDAMSHAIDARDAPAIENIFARTRDVLAVAAGEETRYKKAKHTEARLAAYQIRRHAERLLGQCLIDTGENGTRFLGRSSEGEKSGTAPPPDAITIDKLGISKQESREWQKIAKLPKADFEALLADPTARLTRSGSGFSVRKSRRRGPRVMDYPLHPITDEYADFTPEELEALRLSLHEHGRLLIPIVIWRNQTVDGKHRTKICREEGIPLRYDDVSERCPSEAEMRAYVRALNEHRRANTKPLKPAERRARIEAQLRETPGKPDRQIAEGLGVDHKTVGAVREGLEGRGEIPHVETRRDTKGRKQPARKPKRASNTKRKPPALNDAPHDVDQPGLLFQPALVPDAPEPVSQESVSSDDDALVPAPKTDATPPAAPDQPDPTRDPYAGQRAAVRGSIRGLAKMRDVDYDPVAAPMPLDQLVEASDEADEAAEAHRKWSAALRAAIERATPADQRMPPPA
jgi:hypothetical protein